MIPHPTDPDRLFCIARVVPLQVGLQVGRTPCKPSVHEFGLVNFAAEASGSRLVSSHCAEEDCRRGLSFRARVDHAVHDPDWNISWLFMPVCYQVYFSSYEHRTYENSRRRRFAGLLLQQGSLGELVRVGQLYNGTDKNDADLSVVLEAVRKAKPRFLMIS